MIAKELFIYLYNKEDINIPLHLKIIFNMKIEAHELKHTSEYGMELSDRGITELPDNLHMAGYLDISYNPISELPKNLTVHSINLFETNVTELPDDFVITGRPLYVNDDMINYFKDKYPKYANIIR